MYDLMPRLALRSFVLVLCCLPATAFAQDADGNKALANIDLTEPFHTKTKWSFVITQEPDSTNTYTFRMGDTPPRDYTITELGPLQFCFVQNDERNCTEPGFNTLDSADVIKPSQTAKSPFLVVTAHSEVGGPASSVLSTVIWAYHPRSNTFDQIFQYQSFGDHNEETRIITTGPLAGHIVMSTAPTKAPYHYSITVYRLSKPDRYVEILKFTGKTAEGDGNEIPVIDSEMPRILSRLHLWKPGDALPVPARMAQGCKSLEMRKGTEWCITPN
jgi:hypothetical protein